MERANGRQSKPPATILTDKRDRNAAAFLIFFYQNYGLKKHYHQAAGSLREADEEGNIVTSEAAIGMTMERLRQEAVKRKGPQRCCGKGDGGNARRNGVAAKGDGRETEKR